MKNTAAILRIIAMIIIYSDALAQPWMSAPYLEIHSAADSSKLRNFYEIQKAFLKYEKEFDTRTTLEEREDGEGENEGKFPGYGQFKRWENYMEPRVYPTGDITIPSKKYEEYYKYLKSRPAHFGKKSINGVWTALGPSGTTNENPWGDFSGAARVNFLRFHPTNNNIMWIGTPGGGLWKTTNGGASWTTNTDLLPLIGCSDIAVNPANPQIMYLATGDANGTGSQLTIASIGVLKSTDGGTTWGGNTMNWDVSWGRDIYKLLINPNYPDTVLAATSVGIYRTTNAGTTWTSVQAGQFTDIEFKPGNANVVYASAGVLSGGAFYKSTNAGATFTLISSGLVTTNAARIEIGVTSADTNYVYLAIVKSGSNDFQGFYRSINGGDTFSLRASTPNILAGTAGNQAWYNLAMAVSPFHRDTVIVAGTNIWKTYDGGLTWTKITSESGGLIPFVHPDHHALHILSSTDSVYFSGNDGGVWKSTNYGVSWHTINDGMQAAQMYKLGTCHVNETTVMTGHQDMGTQIYKSGVWNMFTSNTGDGMECIYKYTNDSIIFLESYNGRIIVTTDNHPLFNIVCTTTGTGVNSAGNWITPIIMHPTNDSIILIGKAQIWRSLNSGTSFTQVGNVTGGSGNIKAMAYAPSNPNFIYAAKSNKVFVTTDGNNFVDKTGTLPVGSVSISSLVVSQSDPKKVWVIFSGYLATGKVYFSNDSGTTWSNYSTGLPNIPMNCITYQQYSSNGLYIGTDVGIYFRSDSLASWQPFMTGLPNVDVEEMEIAYKLNKIRAATNGRGLWESDLAVPTVNDTIFPLTACAGNAVIFNNQSLGSPTLWRWSFPGGSPSTSSSPNPSVIYSTPGTYIVTLTVANSNGSSTRTSTVVVRSVPATPTISAVGSTLTSSAVNGNQWYLGSSPISGGTLQNYIAGVSGNYSVRVTDSSGCSSISLPYSFVLPVTLISFTAKKHEVDILLEWATSSEQNSDRFEIERSNDNLDYKGIGSLKSAGNSTSVKNYSLVDKAPLKGNNFYRLKQYDIDGYYKYSPVVIVAFESNQQIVISPVPAKDEIEITSSGREFKQMVQIICEDGKTIESKATVETGKFTVSISFLPKGVYTLLLRDKTTNEFIVGKFIKE